MVPYAKRMEKWPSRPMWSKDWWVHDQPGHHLLQRRFPARGPAGGHHPPAGRRGAADGHPGVEALQYGPIEDPGPAGGGGPGSCWLKGIDCGVDNVIIITGGLEGINLACQAYIDPAT